MNVNKVIILLSVMFFASIATVNAAESASGKLNLDGVDTSGTAVTDVLVVGLSPLVSVYQVTNGTSATASQWFAISSGHPGGNRAYGTAQDVNNIYYQEYDTAAELSTYLQSIPTDNTSSDTWASDWLQ